MQSERALCPQRTRPPRRWRPRYVPPTPHRCRRSADVQRRNRAPRGSLRLFMHPLPKGVSEQYRRLTAVGLGLEYRGPKSVLPLTFFHFPQKKYVGRIQSLPPFCQEIFLHFSEKNLMLCQYVFFKKNYKKTVDETAGHNINFSVSPPFEGGLFHCRRKRHRNPFAVSKSERLKVKPMI